jgi:chromosome segregation ATPase
LASLESRYSSAEGKLGAAREQAASAQEEAAEWRKKYETAALQAKTALERLASVQEQINKIAQERESAIRAEFAIHLEEKVISIFFNLFDVFVMIFACIHDNISFLTGRGNKEITCKD